MLVCNVICFCIKETVILIIYKKYTNFVLVSFALGPWILALGPWPLAIDEMPRILVINILTVKLYLD